MFAAALVVAGFLTGPLVFPRWWERQNEGLFVIHAAFTGAAVPFALGWLARLIKGA